MDAVMSVERRYSLSWLERYTIKADTHVISRLWYLLAVVYLPS